MITKELRAEIRNRRKLGTVVDGKQVPGSIPFLRELLTAAEDPYDRDDLLAEIAGEYLRADLEDEHLLVQRARVANHPDAAVMWLGLAHSLSMRKDGAQEAKEAAAKGVEISRRVGTLIRHALMCQAGIARQINDAELFEHTLRELISDAPHPRENDRGLDDHLLVDLPAGFCAPELEAEYRRLLDG